MKTNASTVRLEHLRILLRISRRYPASHPVDPAHPLSLGSKLASAWVPLPEPGHSYFARLRRRLPTAPSCLRSCLRRTSFTKPPKQSAGSSTRSSAASWMHLLDSSPAWTAQLVHWRCSLRRNPRYLTPRGMCPRGVPIEYLYLRGRLDVRAPPRCTSGPEHCALAGGALHQASNTQERGRAHPTYEAPSGCAIPPLVPEGSVRAGHPWDACTGRASSLHQA
jgi:hypothetical protein